MLAGLPLLVSVGCDKKLKYQNLSSGKVAATLGGHNGNVKTVTASPDMLASGGDDGIVIVRKPLGSGRCFVYPIQMDNIAHSVCFSGDQKWLAIATRTCIEVWGVERVSKMAKLGRPEFKVLNPVSSEAPGHHQIPCCVSLGWTSDSGNLLGGYSDGHILVWGVKEEPNVPDEHHACPSNGAGDIPPWHAILPPFDTASGSGSLESIDLPLRPSVPVKVRLVKRKNAVQQSTA